MDSSWRPLHCPSYHEPVVTDDLCVYCRQELETRIFHYASTKRPRHDPHSCPECRPTS